MSGQKYIAAIKKHRARTVKNKIGRNEPCPCNSGNKYKKCCIDKNPERIENTITREDIKSAEARLYGLLALRNMGRIKLAGF